MIEQGLEKYSKSHEKGPRKSRREFGFLHVSRPVGTHTNPLPTRYTSSRCNATIVKFVVNKCFVISLKHYFACATSGIKGNISLGA